MRDEPWIHTRGSKLNIYQLLTDVQYEKMQRSSRKIFVELLIMHAGMWICSYGNYYRIHFLNNQFINVILRGTRDLQWL